jgi:hypothetical protein
LTFFRLARRVKVEVDKGTRMIRSKYLLSATVIAAFCAFGCYPKAALAGNAALQGSTLAQAEDAAPDAQAETPPPRSPLRVNSFDYEDAGEAGKLTIAGVALPGNDLYLYFDDRPLAKVVPDEAGQWSVESNLKLDDGRHTLRAEQYDPTTRMLAARAMVTIARAKQPSDGAPKTP